MGQGTAWICLRTFLGASLLAGLTTCERSSGSDHGLCRYLAWVTRSFFDLEGCTSGCVSCWSDASRRRWVAWDEKELQIWACRLTPITTHTLRPIACRSSFGYPGSVWLRLPMSKTSLIIYEAKFREKRTNFFSAASRAGFGGTFRSMTAPRVVEVIPRSSMLPNRAARADSGSDHVLISANGHPLGENGRDVAKRRSPQESLTR